jgi:hypothetical protein
MASPKFSFIFITPEEFENCRKVSAEAARTASLPQEQHHCLSLALHASPLVSFRLQ